jgi:hypothetical protein
MLSGILFPPSNQFLLRSFRDGNWPPIPSGDVGEPGEFEGWVLRGAGSAGARSGDHLDGKNAGKMLWERVLVWGQSEGVNE